MPLGRRAGGVFVVAVLVAFLAAVVAGRAGAAGPIYGPAVAAYAQLQTTRATLAKEATAYAEPYPRAYINNAIMWLDDALQPFRWSSTGLVLNDYQGLPALNDMRTAAAWLVWGDTGL